ncbi:zinc-binding alcohol dehydrogenase family protein [Spirosoma sp. KCTC 42546]|uniref:zinc-binding alcohol dehydrogenase family protein n=1 Tax=Spirosoma sp. KCTC 42546 TaxID=2520506 RepID=UPI00115A58F1|nr:zinc-binding alcohol dehydrogenase family protein [Spirosoma sp. KCTC 42546]QDK81039.1 zinc-binding alcohol dehydrogenase family protein [Spirosoma sp. KCTC 42546]
MNKQRALVLVEPGRTEVRTIDIPELSADEVLLKINMVGFCGGDLNGFRGLFELQEYPNVLGHEVGATVVETGSQVPDQFKPGMKVTLNPYQNCGTCLSCRKGRPNACQDNKTMGVRRPGAMTDFIAVPWQKLHASDRLSVRELALVEPLTVGFHAVARGRVMAGEKVAVIGCGIVGMGAVAASVSRGADVIAIDIDDAKMRTAKLAGAAHTINTTKVDLHEALMEITDGDGPDVIIEAVGNPATYRAAVEEVAYTGRVVYIGYAKKPVDYNTGTFVRKEIEILGSRNCLGDFPDVISYLEAGKFPVDAVISKVVSLDEAGAALADWSANPGPITKIMVNFDSESN